MSSSDKPAAGISDILRMTAEVAAAYVGNNAVAVSQIPEIIRIIHTSLSALDHTDPVPTTDQKPLVPVKKSVTPDYIICLEDGKKLKMLKRHLRTAYSMTPE